VFALDFLMREIHKVRDLRDNGVGKVDHAAVYLIL
jgi:hypothetical protein